MDDNRNTGDETNALYMGGDYLKLTGGTWHLEDAGFKSQVVLAMLNKHPELSIQSVCEIGCGAGGTLADLQAHLPNGVGFTGYEISPQAHALSQQFANEHCTFRLGDAFAGTERYDLVLAMDVIEHVEDCFAFLRKIAKKGSHKIYHIPLDAYASNILRGNHNWDTIGHLHLFTIETALKTIAHTGQTVIDWALTGGAYPVRGGRTKVANAFRRTLSLVSKEFAQRLVGGYSILILSR